MGGCRCTFRSCPVSTQKFPNMSFFHYPLNKKDRLEKWVQYSDYAVIEIMPNSQARNRAVCGLHFRDECFMNYKKNRLTPTAVPSLDRLGSGQVIDYSLGEDTKPTTLPPTKEQHLIPPAGVLVWGKPPEFWNSYATSVWPKRLVVIKDSRAEPPAKKPRTTDVPRILNKEIRMIANASMNGNIEFDENTTISLSDEICHQDEDVAEVVNDNGDDDDACDIDFIQSSSCHVTNRSGSPVFDTDLDEIEFLSENQNEPGDGDALIRKSTLQDKCFAYENEILLLKKQLEASEKDADKQIAELRLALTNTKISLDVSGNLAAAWKSKVDEIEKKLANVEAKNQELLQAKASESLPVAAIPIKQPSAPSLSKPQLFNGIKKYLSASMTALVRMEMFGSSERSWKPDEKQVSVELLKLGEDVYKYFRDEWRFRLPPKKMVEQWMNEVEEEDVDDL